MEALADQTSELCVDFVPVSSPPVAPVYNFHQPPYLTHISQDFSSTRGNNYLKGCKWSPDGTCLLTCSADSTLRIFNTPDLSSLPQSPLEWKSALLIQAVDLVYDYVWHSHMSSSDQSTSCVFASSKTAPIHLLDAFDGSLRASYIAKDNADQVTAAFSVAVNPDGTLIYGGYDKAVRVFDISRPGEDCDLLPMGRKDEGQGGMISSIAFDPTGVGVVAFGSYNRTVGLYSLDGELITLMESHRGGVTHVKFSVDGRKLFSGARQDDSIYCWDIRTGKVLYEMKRRVDTNQRVYFDIDPSGRYLASGQSDGKLLIWDISSGSESSGLLNPLFEFQLHEDMLNGMSFHPFWCVLSTASGQRRMPDPAGFEADDLVLKGPQEECVKLWYAG